MSNEDLEVIDITPDPDSLVISHTKNHGVYECSEKTCSFKTHSPSVLGLHKAAVHKITTGAAKKGQVHHYFCPVSGCCYNPKSGRYFKTLDVLRAHYMNVHSEKKFKCSKCNKAFGLERDCAFHEKDCGQSFFCLDCGKEYGNKKALSMHCLSKGHRKPPELGRKVCKSNVTSTKKPATEKHDPVPILPKPLPLENISALLPVSNSMFNANRSKASVTTITLLPQNTSVCDAASLTIQTSPKLVCDNDTQTIRSLTSASSQTAGKHHVPSQAGLFILERAMRSSKIPVKKYSKASQKSCTEPFPRKRKISSLCPNIPKKRKGFARMTVATLTDPSLHSSFSQNTESQTVYSMFGGQLKAVPLNVMKIQDKCSTHTQTQGSESYNFIHLPNDYVMNPTLPVQPDMCTVALQCPIVGNDSPVNSVSQTFEPFISQTTKESFITSETQTCLKQSFNSDTQTQEILALDSSTQTLQTDPGLKEHADFLNELLTENERNDVDTQTFGSFFSDMMTQTLEQSALLPATENSDVNDIFGLKEMTTQTFDNVTDNNTQTFSLDITDCMTQTTFRNDTMTQTLSNSGIDMMTQTFDAANLEYGSQFPSLQNSHSLHQPVNMIGERNELIVQDLFENNGTSTQTPDKQETGSIEMFSTDSAGENHITMAVHKGCDNPMENSSVSILPVQECARASGDTLSQPLNTLFGEVSTQVINSVSDSTTQTLLSPNEDQILETLLSDMATQTFEHDGFSLDDFLDPSLDFVSQLNQEAPLIVADFACQTRGPSDSVHQAMTDIEDDFSMDLSTLPASALTESGSQVDNLLWEMATQTDVDNSWEIGTQTGVNEIGVIGTQTMQELLEIATQTTAEDVWEIGTQTGTRNPLEIATQTRFGDNGNSGIQNGYPSLEMSTQTGRNILWEMATQTGLVDFGVVGTQTSEDHLWGMATQTGFGTLWGNATQTAYGSSHGVTGTQTEKSNFWEMATQTGLNDVDVVATQTDKDSFWEMATQTGLNDVDVAGTQTDKDSFWEMATQTGLEDLWEMATQTEGTY